MDFDMPTCGACRTCEIACSYHHSGEFTLTHSSMRIVDKQEGEGYKVFFVDPGSPQGISCDGCPQEEEPLCMEVCKDKEVLYTFVQEFLAKAGGSAVIASGGDAPHAEAVNVARE